MKRRCISQPSEPWPYRRWCGRDPFPVMPWRDISIVQGGWQGWLWLKVFWVENDIWNRMKLENCVFCILERSPTWFRWVWIWLSDGVWEELMNDQFFWCPFLGLGGYFVQHEVTNAGAISHGSQEIAHIRNKLKSKDLLKPYWLWVFVEYNRWSFNWNS